SRIPKRIAPATKIAQIFFNKRVKQRRSLVEKREFEYNLDLLKAFDANLVLNFQRPLFKIENAVKNTFTRDFIIFHSGFGGSSDGNLKLDDYLKLAKKASEHVDVVFSFGPDDEESKKYIEVKLDFQAKIKDDFKTLMELTEFISSSKLFISTSTGPMHLAGMTNTRTLSFFGEKLFASPKRWGTISDEVLQNNFTVPLNYDNDLYMSIETRVMKLIHE
ncbi:MAG: glycosyltransferase family 9 protein, partial [Bacteroidales bacterium]|nr:glycosyltransferase family 9 protein [Bacteroidales bacterium]